MFCCFHPRFLPNVQHILLFVPLQEHLLTRRCSEPSFYRVDRTSSQPTRDLCKGLTKQRSAPGRFLGGWGGGDRHLMTGVYCRPIMLDGMNRMSLLILQQMPERTRSLLTTDQWVYCTKRFVLQLLVRALWEKLLHSPIFLHVALSLSGTCTA